MPVKRGSKRNEDDSKLTSWENLIRLTSTKVENSSDVDISEDSKATSTDFLTEFLSSVVMKDYKKAVKYCELVLQREPQNTTAREFYPLLQKRLKRQEYDSLTKASQCEATTESLIGDTQNESSDEDDSSTSDYSSTAATDDESMSSGNESSCDSEDISEDVNDDDDDDDSDFENKPCCSSASNSRKTGKTNSQNKTTSPSSKKSDNENSILPIIKKCSLKTLAKLRAKVLPSKNQCTFE